MKQVVVILQIMLLFIVYEIGVLLQNAFHLFIPGSVIGLVLMFTVLVIGVLKVRFIAAGARFMNKHLVLFFIPATVGIMNYYQLFAGKGSLLIIITIISTVCVMASAGITSQLLAKKGERENA